MFVLIYYQILVLIITITLLTVLLSMLKTVVLTDICVETHQDSLKSKKKRIYSTVSEI